MQRGPSALLLEKKPQFILKGLPEEAVDERVQAAVGKGRQPDGMPCQGIVLPQVAAACVTSYKVNAYKHILWEPAEEED